MATAMRRTPSSAPLATVGDPARDLEEMREHMGQLMQSVFPNVAFANGGIWAPPVDIEETDDAWIVEAEVPGVRRDDVHVELRDNELMISGEIEERERKGLLRRRTRRTGRFEYRVTLPGETDEDGVDASLNDGVLTVRIPKAERARAREVEIKSS